MGVLGSKEAHKGQVKNWILVAEGRTFDNFRTLVGGQVEIKIGSRDEMV